MIVLRRVSFPPQKRQSWFEWSLTVAIFSARNSSTAAPTGKAQWLTEAALLLDGAALVTQEGVVPVNLAGKSRPTLSHIF